MPASIQCSETYSDVEKLLDNIVWRHVKRFGGDYEELRAEANFHYMRVYNDYNHKRGSFSARLGFILAYRFLDLRRKEKRKKQIKIVRIPLGGGCHIVKREGRDFPADLSDDAMTVVKLVYMPNEEVTRIAQAGLGTRNPNSMTYAIRCFLMDCGWSTKRIYNCFSEISEALLPY